MNVIYSLPYIAVFLICLLLSAIAKKNNKCFCVVVMIAILTVFAGLRADSVGVDTSSYVSSLQNGYYKLYETGFQKLSSFFEGGKNIEIYLMLIGAIIYTLVIMRLWELRDVVDFSFSVFLFLIIHFIPSMNTMRQYIACAIVFWATRFLFSNKVVPYCLCVLVAMSFHRTAIMAIAFLLIYFLSWKQMKDYQKLIAVLFLLLLPAGLYYIYVSKLDSYILERLDLYFTKQGELGIFIFVQIFTILCVYFLAKRDRLRASHELRRICNIAFFFALLGAMVSLIGYYALFMGRLALYFEIFTMVFYAIIWKITAAQPKVGTEKSVNKTVISQNAILTRSMILFITIFPFVMQVINNSYKVLPYILR